ncbi:MAG: SPFH domain-containing protein [Phycisphaerae bacterium]
MPGSDSPPRIVRPSIPSGPHWIVRLAAGVCTLAAAIGAVYWFVIRVEVRANEILILVNKTGKTIPDELADQFSDQVVLYPALVQAVAQHTGETAEQVRNRYKGIRYEVLTEGRYFPNPYYFKTIKVPATNIGQNEIGVKIRRYGKPLPFPKTVATEADERGPVADILQPGVRYNVNTLAYEVQRFPAIQIPEGRVGVVTLLSGTEPENKNTYTVQPGEKGVQRQTLPPGLEYYNPYLKQIEIVDVRSHKYDMLDADAIHFPSNDSFTISIEGTIEWAIRPDKVAEVTVAYGAEHDILDKIILPNARSISRIQGSKLRARDFISGKTRTAFQERLLLELRRECWQQGIDIKSALVRDIQPPAEIASLISQREQADQEIERSMNEMEEAKAEVKLVEQQELQDRNRALGDMRRDVVTVTKQAEQSKTVAITDANRELEVAKLDLQAAEKQASAIKSRGQAQANVVLFDYQARAEPLAAAVNAFGDGNTYAQQFFLQRVAPSIQSILSNTDGPFAEIFKQFQTFHDDPASSRVSQGGGQ